MHGALLLGLVSGLVASRLPGLDQNKRPTDNLSYYRSRHSAGRNPGQLQSVSKKLFLHICLGSLPTALCSWYWCYCDCDSWQGLLIKNKNYMYFYCSLFVFCFFPKGSDLKVMALRRLKTCEILKNSWSGSQTHPSSFHCG